MKHIMSGIGKWQKIIKQERISRGWTFDDLEIRTGLNRSNLWQIENGKTNVGLDSLEKILKALKLSFEIKGQIDGQNG